MRTRIAAFIACGLGVLALAVAEPAREALQVYAAPGDSHTTDDYAVRVRLPNGPWRNVSVYRVKVDVTEGTRRNPSDAAMAYFDFSGAVDVQVVRKAGPARVVRLRPASAGAVPKCEGATVTFSLSAPANLAVEFDGDFGHTLHLFAGAIGAEPDRGDPNVVFFGPGVHTLPNGRLVAKSGQTIYFAGGAVIRGLVSVAHVDHVRICGRGFFDESKAPIAVSNSRQVEIDGLMVSRSIVIAESQDITVRNLKTISEGAWGDGIDIYCSRDVLLENLFLRTSDDCIAVYAHRNRWSGNVQHVVVRNATLWADVAHPILIGTHGNTPHPERIEDLTFQNIDILDHCEPQLDYQGCLAINVSDANLVTDVRFEDVRVDDFRCGQLVNLRVAWNRKYASSPGRGIENVTFRNVSYRGTHAVPSIIAGYDESRKIRNVVFENLMINGVLITDTMDKPAWFKTADLANFFIGEHVEGVVFRAAPASAGTLP